MNETTNIIDLNEVDFGAYSYDQLKEFKSNLSSYMSDEKERLDEEAAEAKAADKIARTSAGGAYLQTLETGDDIVVMYKDKKVDAVYTKAPKEGKETFWCKFTWDGEEVSKWRYFRDIVVPVTTTETEEEEA